MAINLTLVSALRWSARLFGLLFGGFFLFMFIGESFGDWSSFAKIKPWEAVSLAGLVVYAVCMFAALRWERNAVLVGAAAYAVHYVLITISGGFTSRGGLNPFFVLFWAPIVLYIACWWIEHRVPAPAPAAAD